MAGVAPRTSLFFKENMNYSSRPKSHWTTRWDEGYSGFTKSTQRFAIEGVAVYSFLDLFYDMDGCVEEASAIDGTATVAHEYELKSYMCKWMHDMESIFEF
jgi:hypothetical protein